MSKFKVGDRVRIVESCLEGSPAGLAVVGDTGTLVKIDKKPYPYAVHRDASPDPYGVHWCAKIELIQQPVIVITTDGKTTTATKRLGKKVLGTATARCNPGDKFDFDIGAAIALARLCGCEIRFHAEEPAPEKNPLPEKLVCIWTNAPDWTEGKVYRTRPGTGTYDMVYDNDGVVWILSEMRAGGYYVDVFDGHIAQFIPLVED